MKPMSLRHRLKKRLYDTRSAAWRWPDVHWIIDLYRANQIMFFEVPTILIVDSYWWLITSMPLIGKAILFLDLSADPGLFEGPKGDIQVRIYQIYFGQEIYWIQ